MALQVISQYVEDEKHPQHSAPLRTGIKGYCRLTTELWLYLGFVLTGLNSKRKSHVGSRVKEARRAGVERDVLFGSGGRTATWKSALRVEIIWFGTSGCNKQ